MKCWQWTFLQITDTFTFVRVIGLLTYLHIMFTLHVYDLTYIFKGGGDGGGVTEENAAKPATTVWDFVSTFVSMKPLDIFKETSGQFPAVFAAPKKNNIFQQEVGTISWTVTGDQNRYFKPKLAKLGETAAKPETMGVWNHWIFCCICGDESRYFKPKHDLFLSKTKWLLYINLTSISTVLE